jgi:hypothetical protein
VRRTFGFGEQLLDSSNDEQPIVRSVQVGFLQQLVGAPRRKNWSPLSVLLQTFGGAGPRFSIGKGHSAATAVRLAAVIKSRVASPHADWSILAHGRAPLIGKPKLFTAVVAPTAQLARVRATPMNYDGDG